MKTQPTISADRLQFISQILGIGRGQYFDTPAPTPRRVRASTSRAAKAAQHQAVTDQQPAKVG